VCRGRSNACNPLALQIDKNLGNPVVKKVWVRTLADHRGIRLLSANKELFKLYDVKLTMSTAYHPQTDGQTKRVNQCLEMYLRCAVHDAPKQWKNWLSLAELWYNSSYHSSLGCSPLHYMAMNPIYL
jgi:hypothetical protein